MINPTKTKRVSSTILKSWRLSQSDCDVLEELAGEMGIAQVDVIRLGIRELRDSRLRKRVLILDRNEAAVR